MLPSFKHSKCHSVINLSVLSKLSELSCLSGLSGFQSWSTKRLSSLILSVFLTACGGGGSDSPSHNSNDHANTDKDEVIVDTNWQPAGGVATVRSDVDRPFLQIIPTLPATSLSGVSQGRELFISQWTPAGVGRPLFDGVGPMFNANACSACHDDAGRVPTYLHNGQMSHAILFRVGDKQGHPHAVYGGQIQHQSIASASGAEEGSVTYQLTAGNDDHPQGVTFAFTPTDSTQPLTANSASAMQKHLSGRISPQLVGMGLLDLIAEDEIIANADADDKDNNGISGRVHWVYEQGANRVGRFGWKAINSSLRTQNANAMSEDMGLTTSVFPEPNCSSNQPICWVSAFGGTPEVSDSSLTAVVDFMTALGVPERRFDNQESFNQGATLFAQVGCVNCHTPKHTTGESHRFPTLSNQTIYPYTDLLLHDMGNGLDDGVKEKNAESYEWKTPPLWGIGLVAEKEGARFLHDGRASSLKEAILWHGGEAEMAKKGFESLSEAEKQQLLAFLRGI